MPIGTEYKSVQKGTLSDTQPNGVHVVELPSRTPKVPLWKKKKREGAPGQRTMASGGGNGVASLVEPAVMLPVLPLAVYVEWRV